MINLGLLPRGKYMEATLDESVSAGRKTPIYTIHELKGAGILGAIAWYGPWRGYCFFPEFDTIFDSGCLQQIREWIAELDTRYKQAAKGATTWE
jgi:hypothetical protein